MSEKQANPNELVACGVCGVQGDLRQDDTRVHGKECPR